MPNVAGWRLASIPRFLPDADIARIIACDGERPARLSHHPAVGPARASGERAAQLDDIDWRQGSIRLWQRLTRGTAAAHLRDRRRALAYIERGRSATGDTIPVYHRICAAVANRPASRSNAWSGALSALASAEPRVRISCATGGYGDAPPRRQPAGVSTVLRHRSQAMTAHYAKGRYRAAGGRRAALAGRSPC